MQVDPTPTPVWEPLATVGAAVATRERWADSAPIERLDGGASEERPPDEPPPQRFFLQRQGGDEKAAEERRLRDINVARGREKLHIENACGNNIQNAGCTGARQVRKESEAQLKALKDAKKTKNLEPEPKRQRSNSVPTRRSAEAVADVDKRITEHGGGRFHFRRDSKDQWVAEDRAAQPSRSSTSSEQPVGTRWQVDSHWISQWHGYRQYKRSYAS